MTDEELIEKYIETNDQIYFNELYSNCISIKNKFINSNNVYYIELEAIFDDAFMKTVANYNLEKDIKFKYFLKYVLKNEFKYHLKKEYELKKSLLDISIFQNENGEFNDNIQKLVADDFNLENYCISYDEYYRLYDFFIKYLNNYMYEHNGVVDIDYIVITRILRGKTFKEIGLHLNRSAKGVEGSYIRFIKKFRFTYRRYYIK